MNHSLAISLVGTALLFAPVMMSPILADDDLEEYLEDRQEAIEEHYEEAQEEWEEYQEDLEDREERHRVNEQRYWRGRPLARSYVDSPYVVYRPYRSYYRGPVERSYWRGPRTYRYYDNTYGYYGDPYYRGYYVRPRPGYYYEPYQNRIRVGRVRVWW